MIKRIWLICVSYSHYKSFETIFYFFFVSILLAPPSYESISRNDGGVHVNGDDEHNMGKQMFNPRYPMYDFGNGAATAAALNLAGTSEDAPSYGWAANQPDAHLPDKQ